MPAARAVLETLPGVGRKTANVVLNVAFGEETFAVDTHVFRVGNRTGMAPGKTPLEVELELEQIVPPAFRLHAHHWLILHGRYICKAQRPLCEKCPINDLCRWPEKTTFMQKRRLRGAGASCRNHSRFGPARRCGCGPARGAEQRRGEVESVSIRRPR